MLNNLFKPAWQSGSVEKRRKAIAELHGTSVDDQQILAQLASDDSDVSIRIAAVQRLSDVIALHDLSKDAANDNVVAAAEKRINELMATEGAFDEAQYRDLLDRFPELRVRIAIHSCLKSIRKAAIQNLLSESLLDVLGATVYTDCRHSIAEMLDDIEDLESARKIMRGKDKIAERIIKTKIDDFRSHQRQLAENKSQVEKLIEEVEYLAGHDWLPEFGVRCRTHRQQWDSLAFDIEDDDRQRYQLARRVVDANYERQCAIEQTREAQQQIIVELEDLLRIITGLDIAAAFEVLSQTRTKLQQLDRDWQPLADIVTPEESILRQYQKMSSAILSANRFVTRAADLLRDAREDNSRLSEAMTLLGKALKNLDWPADFTELKAATEVQQQLEQWREELKASKEEHQQKLARVHKNISSIFRFSRAGNLARAKQTAQKVQKVLNKFEGKDLADLQERFEEASKTLGDMGDWKNFATEPKYIELCEAMALLTTSNQHADKRSAEMKSLQQQWKELGHSDISEQYWPRFKLAADKVYQSCAVFFEQRRAVRKVNLEQRQQHLEEMRELLEATDWDNSPDYQAVQSGLHRINSSFNGIKDLERNAAKKQWKQYSALKDAVMTKLELVYDENIALKQRLIEQAETLAEAEAKVENLTSLKSLQARWKQVGVTRRGEDQKAWKLFKKQGDITYNKVQALRHGQRHEADQQLNAYREIIKAIQQLARTANDLAEADQQFSDLQANYKALPELPHQLPEKLLEGIHRDYRNACHQFDLCHSRIIKSRHNQQREALRQKAGLCARLEALAASSPEHQWQEISQQWDSIELNDTALLRRIEARRTSARSDLDRESIGEERRLLCIRLEILMDVESPVEDRGLRMQYQLQQMNQSGLGQQVVDVRKQIEAIEQDWLCMPGAQADQQLALDERFQRVMMLQEEGGIRR
ncbi:MAG: DUF349 domain-containing protein [Gammaproteobacteria bacterium]|nr:DUF349 domain-containing protein [Gammaproteobacteria bacterium]